MRIVTPYSIWVIAIQPNSVKVLNNKGWALQSLGNQGGQPVLMPVIAIGVVIGFVVSKALAPYLPKLHAQSGKGEF